jgi:hypothetical protein
LQRHSRRELNFGVRLALAIFDLLATGLVSHQGVKKLVSVKIRVLGGRILTLERQSQALQ